LHFCQLCDFQYFNYRYVEAEIDAIYGEYRTEKFFQVRKYWEPWYNKRVNEAFSDPTNSADQIKSRREFTQNALKAAGIDTSNLRGCIDFGGDHGQFIPSGVLEPHIIVENNSSEKGSGSNILFIDDIDDIDYQVDLVMNCYVLEHMSDLDLIIERMRSKVTPQGYIHLEVPLDAFKTCKFHRTKLYKAYLTKIIRIRPLFVLADFLSGLYRQFFGRIPWFGVVKQSEHINYFNEQSLNRFLILSNSSIQYTSKPDKKYKVGSIRQGRLASIIK